MAGAASSYLFSAGDDGTLQLLAVDRLTAAEGAGDTPPTLATMTTLMSTPLPLNAVALGPAGIALAGDDAGTLFAIDCAAKIAALRP